MKTLKLLIAIISISFFTSSFAQRGEKRREDIETFKIAFITKRLDLTTDEATKFWPVYDQYQDELKDLRQKNRKTLFNVYQNIETMSDADVSKVLEDELVFKQNELNLTKKYLPQFKTVLPVKKVAKLFKAEEDFKTELLKRMQQNNR
jgi:hypothetical protein